MPRGDGPPNVDKHTKIYVLPPPPGESGWGELPIVEDRLTPQVLSDRLINLTMKETIELQLLLAKEGIEFIISPGTVQIEQTL